MGRHKEDVREARGAQWIEDLRADIRYGIKALLKNRGFAVLAVLTLGLGIGANTATFSVLNGVLLKPLPYDNGDRLVLIRHSAPLANQQNLGVSIKELYDYRDAAGELRRPGRVPSDELRPAAPWRARSRRNRRRLGEFLRRPRDQADRRPHVRRNRTTREGATPCSSWDIRTGRRGLAAIATIVGQVFEMNDRPHTVIGVLPPVPHYPNEVDVYMPTVGVPVPLRSRTPDRPEPARVLGAAGLRLAQAGRRGGRRPPPKSPRSAGGSGRTFLPSTGRSAPGSRPDRRSVNGADE